MPQPVRTHVFRRQRWKIRFDRLLPHAYGECSHGERKIAIDPNVGGLGRLDVLVHEAMHACFPDLDEDEVDEYSWDIARFLWRLGYRGPDDD